MHPDPAAWIGRLLSSTVNLMKLPISQVWTFDSDSNRSTQYETLRYTDGSTSCNCAGWTRRVAADGTRSCKHTRAVDMGNADRLASTTHRYQPLTTIPNHHYADRKTTPTPKLGHRRFHV